MWDDVRGSDLSVTRVIVKDICYFIVIAVIIVSLLFVLNVLCIVICT
jgi:hypothetical protein